MRASFCIKSQQRKNLKHSTGSVWSNANAHRAKLVNVRFKPIEILEVSLFQLGPISSDSCHKRCILESLKITLIISKLEIANASII